MKETRSLCKFLNSSSVKFEYSTRKMEINAYLNGLFNNSNSTQNCFVIFSLWRTGSNLLVNLLNSHPEVTCEGEIFLPFINSRFKKVILPHLYLKGRQSKSKTNTYGFSFKLYQKSLFINILHGSPEKFIFNLFENGWKIIHIKRVNVLRQAISKIVASARGQWNDFSNKPIIRSKVNIECEKLIDEIKWFEKLSHLEEGILQPIPHLRVVYENDLLRIEDHQKTADIVFRYLGLSSAPVKTNLRRVSSDNLSDSIENYEELMKSVHKTKYDKFVEYL